MKILENKFKSEGMVHSSSPILQSSLAPKKQGSVNGEAMLIKWRVQIKKKQNIVCKWTNSIKISKPAK